MYQGWITHTHTHLAGKCPHGCAYCAIQDMARRYPVMKERYSGPLRLIDKEFDVKYGSGKTIFMENCNDLFAADVPQPFINKVIAHCLKWPDNTYVFQTKNPSRYLTMDALFPSESILGATIETNREIPDIGKAPSPLARAEAMAKLQTRKFITIEPVIDFDVEIMLGWLFAINPEFVNIGADSKHHRLQEPPYEKVEELIKRLQNLGIEVREKSNLERLKSVRP